jgi:hypothetical protein
VACKRSAAVCSYTRDASLAWTGLLPARDGHGLQHARAGLFIASRGPPLQTGACGQFSGVSAKPVRRAMLQHYGWIRWIAQVASIVMSGPAWRLMQSHGASPRHLLLVVVRPGWQFCTARLVG